MNYHFALPSRIINNPLNPLSIPGASLDDRFNPTSLDSSETHSWHKPVYSVHYPAQEALAFPDELWLNTASPQLEFDLRIDMHGIFLSQAAYDSLQHPIDSYFKVAKLHIVNRQGKGICNQDMFYAKPLHQVHVLDEEKTIRETVQVMSGYFPITLRNFSEVKLRNDLREAIIAPIALDNCMLFKNEVAEIIRDANLNGVDIVPEASFVERYNNRLEFCNADGSPAVT